MPPGHNKEFSHNNNTERLCARTQQLYFRFKNVYLYISAFMLVDVITNSSRNIMKLQWLYHVYAETFCDSIVKKKYMCFLFGKKTF